MAKDITIWYADDDDDDAFLFDAVINDIGVACDCLIFRSGIDLIKRFESTKAYPDVIYMDINMPLKNGLECLKDIKSNEKWDHIPVYVFSTSDAEVYKLQAISLGALGYIVKPTSFTEMKEILRESIEAVLPGIVI